LFTPLTTHIVRRPPIRPWVWFNKLGLEFNSPLVYLNLAGQDIVVVNDYQAGIDLVGLSALFRLR
jgi:hypothetical protein